MQTGADPYEIGCNYGMGTLRLSAVLDSLPPHQLHETRAVGVRDLPTWLGSHICDVFNTCVYVCIQFD